MSGSFWAHQQKPRTPSVFLRELADASLIKPLPLGSSLEEPPERESLDMPSWPPDPLGSRREVVTQAADLVTQSLPDATTPHDEAVVLAGALLERGGLSEQPHILPVRLPASSLEVLANDPRAYAQVVARPLPRAPHPAALLGTLFHTYVEQRLGTTVPRPLVESEEGDGESLSVYSFDQWKQKFEASEFAHSTPVAIETELHLPVAGHLIICKLDAVFETPTGVRIVDWKTGKKPATEAQVEAKSIQLAAYRLAWSEWSGMPLDAVAASFWFVEDEELITPAALLDREGLASIISDARASLG